MTISLLTAGEMDLVSRLAGKVFDRHVAPLYTEEGRGEFYRYIDPPFLTERLGAGMMVWGARDNGDLVGLLAMKDPSHISLFFVDCDRQGQGIGRLLFDRAAAEAAEQGIPALTVNSSPNAVGVYTSLGFQPDGPAATTKGITYHRMSRPLSDYLAARRGESVTDGTLLAGPFRFMVSGYGSDERGVMNSFLSGLLGKAPGLRPLTLNSLEGSLGALLEGDEAPDPLPADKLPRVLLLSGISYAEVRSVVEHWSGSGLPRPIFATTTARNLHFPVRELLTHLMEERRRQTGKDN
jgi:GNAT superfamily N-acetyltransferase